MKLIMMRHGQTDLNKHFLIQGRIDPPLNNQGIKDAKKSAQIIFDNIESIDVFISSPLKRAFQSTTYVAKKFNYFEPIILDEHFYERDFGPYDGLEIKDVWPITKFVEGYEKDEEIQERVLTGINKLYKKYHGKTVLIGCHSHTIKAILTKIIKDYQWNTRLVNGAVFIFQVNNNSIELVKELNHL